MHVPQNVIKPCIQNCTLLGYPILHLGSFSHSSLFRSDFFDLRYTIRVVSRAITLGFYHVILMHSGICEHGLPMLTFSALCEYFDAGTSRCVVCWGVANNLEGCGDSTVHRGCVLALLRSKLKFV